MNNKRNLHITFDEHLGSVMEEQMMDEIRWFIDLEKSEMVGLATEAISEYYEMEEDDWKALEAKDEKELNDIEYDMLRFDEIESKNRERYLAVEPADHWVGYEDMKAFITTVGDEGQRNRLLDAIQGKGAFRRFKDAVERVPGMIDTWYKFKRLRQRERISEWLASEGISCTFDPI